MVGLATRLRDSAFKQTLQDLEVGDEVEVEEPKGSFLLPEDTSAEYVFVAGGIGITVFRSMLRYIADERLPYRVTLVYSNRDRESAAFLDELEELEARIDGLRLVLTMTDDDGWEGQTRHLDADVLGELVDGLEGKTFLVAGPPEMAQSVADSLTAAGLPEDRVLADKFSGY
jgi:ferredoxin-NADP reductase